MVRLTIPREQSRRQWWDIWYHGNSVETVVVSQNISNDRDTWQKVSDNSIKPIERKTIQHYQCWFIFENMRTCSNVCIDHYYNIHGMTHIHETRNLVYQTLTTWRHTSRTQMDTTWIGPSLNGTDLCDYVKYFQRLWFDFCITLPCEIRASLTAILAMNATWLLAQEDATTWLHERKRLSTRMD